MIFFTQKQGCASPFFPVCFRTFKQKHLILFDFIKFEILARSLHLTRQRVFSLQWAKRGNERRNGGE